MGEPSAAYSSPVSRPIGRSNSLRSVRFSGKAFVKLPRVLPPTGRSLCGTEHDYSYPVIEYNGILSQPFFSVKHNLAIFHGVVQIITMFLHGGRLYVSRGLKWFSKQDYLDARPTKMKERTIYAAKTPKKPPKSVLEALILKEFYHLWSQEMDNLNFVVLIYKKHDLKG